MYLRFKALRHYIIKVCIAVSTTLEKVTSNLLPQYLPQTCLKELFAEKEVDLLNRDGEIASRPIEISSVL